MARRGVTVLMVLVAYGVLPAVAAADTPVVMCVPSAANTAITTPQSDGTCPSGKTKRTLADEADLTAAKTRIGALEAKLTGVTRGTSNGQPTLTISGENVRIVNGAGSTATVNGRGNLFLGYNATPGTQGGSHDVVVGDSNTANSFGSLVVGQSNRSWAHGETVLGYNNGADHAYATATGGSANQVTATYATVAGGAFNKATGPYSSITGGACNIAGPGTPHSDARCGAADPNFLVASVAGGVLNSATGAGSSVSGGSQGTASGRGSSVSGGDVGTASGPGSSFSGGAFGHATGPGSAVSGGAFGVASNDFASVSGGEEGAASGQYSSVSGGYEAKATADFSSNLGGYITSSDTLNGTYPAGP